RLDQSAQQQAPTPSLIYRSGCLTFVDTLRQVRVYMTDMELWGEFDALYGEWIGEHRPARAVAGVCQLHFGALIEIEATAAFSADRAGDRGKW
ncbi:RidA family protein, partial [Aurantimonas sp. C2-5-R2]|uniref:RidA family protein n=1 Tax=Aurantimonas sp. C2-5-R2 TaxID=3113713 RepID=UPI002F942FF5